MFCQTFLKKMMKLDLCHLTEKCRGAARSHCYSNAKQKYSAFIPKAMHSMTQYDSDLIFKEILNRKDPFVHFDFIPETDAIFISITFEGLKLFGSSNFTNMGFGTFVKALKEETALCESFIYPKYT